MKQNSLFLKIQRKVGKGENENHKGFPYLISMHFFFFLKRDCSAVLPDKISKIPFLECSERDDSRKEEVGEFPAPTPLDPILGFFLTQTCFCV